MPLCDYLNSAPFSTSLFKNVVNVHRSVLKSSSSVTLPPYVISPSMYLIASYGTLGLLHRSLSVSTAAVKSDSLNA
jgi:hypothetical protein